MLDVIRIQYLQCVREDKDRPIKYYNTDFRKIYMILIILLY